MTTIAGKRQEALELAKDMQGGCLGVRVGRLHRLVARRFEAALRPLRLTLSQLEVLTALTLSGGPVKPAYVAEKLSVERSTMSRNLTLMEERGLVKTTARSATDRSLAVTITDRGTEALVEAEAAWREVQGGVVDLLGADGPSTLDGWLEGLSAAAP